MIPSVNSLLTTNLEIESQPSKTYRMNIEHNVIVGYCDEREAVAQAIYKILNTERYRYIMYSWNYGIELWDLFGQPTDYVCAELRRRIEEALLQDDRVVSVTNFEFDISTRRTVKVSFIAHSMFGDVDVEKAVKY